MLIFFVILFRIQPNMSDAMQKKEDCPLVLVEWLDSVRPIPEWRYLQDFGPYSAIKCTSVGWLLQDGDVKVLAPNMGHTEDEENVQACGVIQIPTCSVIRQVRLKEWRD